MKNNKHLHQPHFLKILFGGIFVVVNRKHRSLARIAHSINQYHLVKEFVKEDTSDRNFLIGIYSDGEKKYFIKTWHGTIKDTHYYSLLNEYLVNETVHAYLNENKSLSHVGTPKVIECITSKNTFSVVFEYIEGETLEAYPEEYQVTVLGKVLESLESVSREMHKEHFKFFARRGFISYFVTLPILVALAIAHNIEEFPTIMVMAFWGIRAFFHTHSTSLVLAHRDIGPDNIIVSGSSFYIVDLEKIALTLPFYDITSLGVEPSYSRLVSLMRNNFLYVEDEFLKIFIFLKRAAFSSNIKSLKAHNVHQKRGIYA